LGESIWISICCKQDCLFVLHLPSFRARCLLMALVWYKVRSPSSNIGSWPNNCVQKAKEKWSTIHF
jgi:hypothetical protein